MTLSKIFSPPVPDAFSFGMQQKNENRKTVSERKRAEKPFFF